MFKKYLIVFFVSMVPLIELRGAIPIAAGIGVTIYTILYNCDYWKYDSCSLHLFLGQKDSCLGS